MEINRNNVPKDIVSPLIFLKPPYQTNNPIQIDVDISAIGKKIEFIHTVLNQASLCFRFISLKLSFSIFSLLNI